MDSSRAWFACAYAVSGAAALIYEICWTRLLSLQIGHSTAAASTVLATYMGGLAAGAWVGGLIDRRLAGGRTHATRLRTYAALELLIAVWAIALPIILQSFVPLLVWAYQDGTAMWRFDTINVLLSAAALVPPTMAMGATFPLAATWMVEARSGLERSRPAEAASTAGFVYAVNSAGAFVGALAAGLLLIPAIGLRATTMVAVLLNGSAAAVALLVARRPETLPGGRTSAHSKSVAGITKRGSLPRGPAAEMPQFAAQWALPLASAAAALSGSVALVYEVAWTRLLALVIGPTTYAFSLVVASFIVGIAAGSAAAAHLVRRSREPSWWLAAMLFVTALAAWSAAWFAAVRLPAVIASRVAAQDAAFSGILATQAAWALLLLVPMSCALGAVFPLAVAVATAGGARLGTSVATVYAWNTAGAIAGALLGGFFTLPRLGLYNTFRAAALIGMLAAVAVWWFAGQARSRVAARLPTAAVAVASVLSVLLTPGWDLNLLASGAYKYASSANGDPLSEFRAWRLLSYQDGAAATVGVRELAGMRSLVIDGKVDASNMGDMLTQRLLGLLPVLLHPDPHDVCVIGLGSGVTAASTLARDTVRHADVVEISPEVVRASAFFDRENHQVLTAPNVRLIIGDGRSHIRLSTHRYDVIVSEPSNPWMAGIAALFTQEFFQDARARLNPGGLMCQWAHTYDMTAGDLRSIVRTFTSVFPEATMWLVGDSDLLLIGGTEARVDVSALGRRCAEGSVAAMLEDVAIDPGQASFALLSMLAGRSTELREYAREAPIQRDDRLALEFSAPRAIYGPTAPQNVATIRELAARAQKDAIVERVLGRPTAERWLAAGKMQFKAGAVGLAYESFERAVRLDGRSPDALMGLTDAAAAAHRTDDEHALLDRIAAAQPDNPAVRIELSRLFATEGKMELAAARAIEAMKIAPADPAPIEQLASVFADAGDAAHLAPLADALVSRFPDREQARYYRANALFLKGDVTRAIEEARAIIARNAGNVQAQHLLGVACATAGNRECARDAFAAALASNPRDATAHVNLGLLHLRSADPGAAVQEFSTALALDPSSASAAEGLAEARALLAASR